MKRIDLFELANEAREIVRECEVHGARTLFERGGRGVAVLVSWDEYVALRETIDISNEPLFYAKLESAEEEVRRGKMLLAEDLEEPHGPMNDRLRFAESLELEWGAISIGDRAAAMAALERIDDDPIAGAPLFEPLKGLWSFRSGELRIVYRIVPESRFVVILSVSRARAIEG